MNCFKNLATVQWKILKPVILADRKFLKALAALVDGEDVIKPNAIYSREETLRLAGVRKDTRLKAENEG